MWGCTPFYERQEKSWLKWCKPTTQGGYPKGHVFKPPLETGFSLSLVKWCATWHFSLPNTILLPSGQRPFHLHVANIGPFHLISVLPIEDRGFTIPLKNSCPKSGPLKNSRWQRPPPEEILFVYYFDPWRNLGQILFPEDFHCKLRWSWGIPGQNNSFPCPTCWQELVRSPKILQDPVRSSVILSRSYLGKILPWSYQDLALSFKIPL